MKELTVEARIENIPEVTDFVDEQLEAYGCSVRARMQIDVAIDELVGNVALYAYQSGAGPVTVRVEEKEDSCSVEISFIDNGMPYDPLKREDPDVTLSAEERGVGGLGIYLVKKSMDGISYEYKDGQNILTIKKNLA